MEDPSFGENLLNIGQNQAYHVRSGTKDSGKAYEKHLIALYAIRGSNSQNEDFWIATNAEVCGDFDDVVIYQKHKSSGQEQIFLLQCKHSDSPKAISAREFFNRKSNKRNNYSLEKYSDSYTSLIKSTSGAKCYMSTKINQLKDNLVCALFTNNSASDECKFLESTQDGFLNTQGRVFRFKPTRIFQDLQEMNEKLNVNEKVNLCQKDSLNEAFLEQLWLFTDQVSNSKMQSFIAEEIEQLLAPTKIPSVVLDEIVTKYVLFITDWAQGELGNHYLLTKAQIIAKLTELLLEKYMYKFNPNPPENLISYNFDTWHYLMQTKQVTFIDMDAGESDSNVISFIHQYLNKIINPAGQNWEKDFTRQEQTQFYQTTDDSIKNEMLRTVGCLGTITVLHLYKTMWKLQKIPMVLEVQNEENLGFVLKVLELSQFKHQTILFNKAQQDLSYRKEVNGIFKNLDDLNVRERREILQANISLQGRLVQLKQLAEVYKPLPKLISARNIVEILNGASTLNIGNRFTKLPEYFIPRTIPKVLLKANKLFPALTTSQDLVMLMCQSKHAFYDYKRQLKFNMDGEYVADWSSLQNDDQQKRRKTDVNSLKVILITQAKSLDDVFQMDTWSKNVHHLELDHHGHLEWIKSIGSTAIIRLSLLEPKSLKGADPNTSLNICEVLAHFSNQINIISAYPGMGKSLLMDYIALNAPPNVWVLRVNLNQHLDYFNQSGFEESHQEPHKHLQYFMLKEEGQVPSPKQEFLANFLQPSSVLVLLDGFDEISPFNKTGVAEMIRSLVQAGYRMWLTTRPALKQYLEEEFNAVALSLSPLNHGEQKEFLTKYFGITLGNKIGLEIDNSKLETFVLHLLELTKTNLDQKHDFTSIPLQIMLVADAFAGDCEKYVTRRGDLSLKKSFDFLSLYEHFARKKLEILASKYGSYTNSMLQSYEEYQQLCALQVVFSEVDLKDLRISSELSAWSEKIKHIEELVQKEGFLTTTTGLRTTFTHRTFAEYLAAKWLSLPTNLERPTVKVLIRKLFQRHNVLIRNIFDRILAKKSPLHVLLISHRLDEAERLIETNPEVLNDKDDGGRLPCHLAASWGFYHSMPYSNELADSRSHNRLEHNNHNMASLLRKMCRKLDDLPKDTIMKLTPLDYAISTDCLANIDAIISIAKVPTKFFEDKIICYSYYCARYGYKSFLNKILSTTNQSKNNFVKYVKRNLLNSHHLNMKLDTNGNTLLHLAAQFGHTDIATLLVSRNADVNVSNVHGETPLHLAVQHGFLKITTLLLQNHADIFARTKLNLTPLHLAILNGSLLIVTYLLDHGADIHATAQDNSTALHLAVNSNSLESLELLASKGADVRAKAKYNCTVLHVAAQNISMETMSLLLSLGVEVNATDAHGLTPLHQAVKRGLLKVATLLISNGADVNARDNDNKTVLYHAAAEGHLEIVRMLLANNAGAHAKAVGRMTALHQAAQLGWSKIAATLLLAGADTDARDIDNMTALHHAVRSSSLKTVSLLVRHGNVNAKDANQMSALHHAAARKDGSLEIPSLLISNGADIHAKDDNNMTPLHYAARYGCLPTVLLLIAHGANVQEKGHRDNTAVMEAVKSESMEVLLLLHSKGADVHTKDYYNNTALHHAVKQGSLKIVQFLLSTDVDVHGLDMYKRTALHLAVKKGSVEMVSLLLSKGGSVCYRDTYGRSLLHIAAQKDLLDIASLLLLNGADVHAKDNDDKTALHYATQAGFADIVKVLVSKGAIGVISALDNK